MQLNNSRSDRPGLNGNRPNSNMGLTLSKFNHSGFRSPCPVCGRTKDRDCSWTTDGKRVLCHTYAKESPPSTANDYHFTGKFCNSGLHGADSAAIYMQELDRNEKPLRPYKVSQFIYHDENGQEVVRLQRTDRKDGSRKFWQEHKDKGQWLKGVPQSIYPRIHLYKIFDPLNQKAIARNVPILIVEGEGKVDLLMEMGIAATCALGGAGKWRGYGYENYLQDLNGAKVVICPDRDKPGIKHADNIAQDFPDAQWLYAFPDSTFWNKLPESGGLDIADWIQDYDLSVEDVLAAIEPRRVERKEEPQLNDQEEIPRLLRDYKLIEAKFGDRLRFNSLFKHVELDGECFDPTSAKLEFVISHRLSIKSSREDVTDITLKLAKQNTYSPVVEYLNGVHQNYGNDTSVLNGFAHRYFGTSDAIHQTLLKKFLVAAVARAYQPGCKFDCALILQGRQGFGKSTFFRVLASEDWFDDSLGSVSDKDERLKLHRAWVIEWAELETVFGRKDINQVKAFMSCSVDQVRPPYGRSIEAMKRASIIVGTTNQQEFLADMTGNRRFWIIPITQPIDQVTLQLQRDRIWASAVTLYRASERWWLTSDEENTVEQERERYEVSDTWYDSIADYVEFREQVSIAEILNQVIQLDMDRHDKLAQNRVRSILLRLQWKPLNNARMHLGKRQKVWIKS